MKTFCKFAVRKTLQTTLSTLALALPVMVCADQPNFANDAQHADRRDVSPLIEKVRRATARYLDINVALNELPEHWVRATPCVSGPNEGAMGVHLVKGSRIGD